VRRIFEPIPRADRLSFSQEVRVYRVAPWISVEPNKNSAAILGPLPRNRGSVTLAIPPSVVPATATGILVFAWAALSGKNAPLAYWHIAATLADGSRNWFSLLVAGDPSGQSVTCNSQAFWLPQPADGKLTVTLFANDLPSAANRGDVEIHGFYPGTPES
jgi:hypothetical protein